jgi:hypothetical protein
MARLESDVEMVSQIILGKRTMIGILLVAVPILIVLSVILIRFAFVHDVGGPIEYFVEITLINDGKDHIDDPANLTISEVLGVPILHDILEEILSNESITSLSRIISREEAEPLTALFDNNGFPLTEYRQFYYKDVLFGIEYIVSTA